MLVTSLDVHTHALSFSVGLGFGFLVFAEQGGEECGCAEDELEEVGGGVEGRADGRVAVERGDGDEVCFWWEVLRKLRRHEVVVKPTRSRSVPPAKRLTGSRVSMVLHIFGGSWGVSAVRFTLSETGWVGAYGGGGSWCGRLPGAGWRGGERRGRRGRRLREGMPLRLRCC